MIGLSSLRREARWLLAVLALAALLRLLPVAAHGVRHDRVTTPDSAGYLELGTSLAAGKGFVREPGGAPELFRTPGYPLLLSALSFLPGRVVAWAIAVQIALGSLVVILTFHFARALFGEATAIIAALLVAVDPAQIVYANMIMSDIPCVAAVAGAFALACSTARGDSWWRPVMAGLCLSLAVAVRPVCGLLWVPLATWQWCRKVGPRQIALLVVAALLFPVGWVFRNGVETGEWTVSTAFDTNLRLVLAPKLLARAEGISLAAARAETGRRLESVQRRRPGIPRHRLERELALELIRAYPGVTLREAAVSTGELLLAGERRNLLRLLGLPRRTDREPSLGELARSPSGVLRRMLRMAPFEAAVVASQLLSNAVVWLFFLIGAVRLWRSGRRRELALAVVALAVVLVPAEVVATGRQRIPVSFLVAIVAAAGVTSLRWRWRGCSAAPSGRAS